MMFITIYRIYVCLWLAFFTGSKAMDDFKLPLVVVIPVCMFILIEFIIEAYELLALLVNCF